MVEDLAQKDIVVFHCSLSQQRGPGAALKYLREKNGGNSKDGKSGVNEKGGDKADKAEKGEGQQVGKGKKEQEVYVLDGGFVKWQEEYVFPFFPISALHSPSIVRRVFDVKLHTVKLTFLCSCYVRYGKDERLTDGYVPEIWQDNFY